MASRNPFHYRPFIVLVVLALAWLLLPVAVQSLLRTSFYEFQAPVPLASSYVRELQDFWASRNHSKQDLLEAGRDIARLNADYQLRLQQNERLRAEVARLEEFLDLDAPPGYRPEVARVVRRDLNAWWQRLIIRKGRSAGIPEGAAVIFRGGVAGRVEEVYEHTAVVQLATSRNFRMAANFELDWRPVTFQGSPHAPLAHPTGTVRDVPADIEASPAQPQRLVSSGLGGIFPEGLTIGYVERLEPGTDGLFQAGEVRLDPRLTALQEVVVLVPVAEEDKS